MKGKVISFQDRKMDSLQTSRVGSLVNPARERFIRAQARTLLLKAWSEERKNRKIEARDIFPIEPAWVLQASKLYRDWNFECPPEIGRSRGSGREIAGVLDRVAKKIEVAANLPPHVRRFTGAHEIGHLTLHPGLLNLRESPLADGRIRDSGASLVEREANVYAAELLIPTRWMRDLFRQRFGGVIDRAFMTDDEAFYYTNGRFSASELKKKDLVGLAMIIAEADSFTAADSRSFTEVFGVSAVAMAIQLVDLGLFA